MSAVAMIGSRGFPGQGGGVERVLEAVAPRLVDPGGWDVWVYCADYVDYDGDDWKGVDLRRLPSLRTKYGDTITRSAMATLRELRGDADVLHFHSIGSAPLALLARLFGRPTVVTVHGLDWQRAKWNVAGRLFLRFGEWAAMRFPNETVVVSPVLRDELEARHRRRVTYIPNGAERRHHVPLDDLASRFGLDADRYVLFLGRLVPEKGAHVLIDAWRRLEDRGSNKLVITGPEWFEADYNRKLRSMAEGDDSIVFTGEADEPMLQELYSNARAFVLPSDIEGMSLALLDALAFGCATIVSDIPENTKVAGEAALEFRTNDAASLARVLARILADDQLVADLRERAERRAATEFDWSRIAEQWIEVYERVRR